MQLVVYKWSCCPTYYLQVWDRRTVGRNPRPAGLFVGHTDGMTHLDPKGDGRYLISNCKDHTVKLWDLRNMMAPGAYDPNAARSAGCEFSWYGFLMYMSARFQSDLTFTVAQCSSALVRGCNLKQTPTKPDRVLLCLPSCQLCTRTVPRAMH